MDPIHISKLLPAALSPTLLPCRAHNLPVTLGYDGVHFISCEKGCEIHDGKNASTEPIIQRWNTENLDK